MLEFNMTDVMASTEIKNYGQSVDLILYDGESKLSITFSSGNLEYLKQSLSPNGLMPDKLEGQIHMFNQLIEELEDIRDKNDPDWELNKVWYDEDKDMVLYDTKEVEI